MIDKKTLKKLRQGDYSTLIEAIECLLGSYEEDKFSLGYASCLSDMSVRSHELAEHISKKAKKYGKTKKDFDKVYFIEQDDLAQIIEDYFNKALNE